MSMGLVLLPTASAATNGPYNFPNSAIADHAETYANGAFGGQCLVFVENMIKAAGGPQLAFGYDTNTYQSQWAQHASPVGSLAEAQRGNIVQWGGGAGGDPHTAIITADGSTPQTVQVIDSNYGWNEQVSRGSLSSRTAPGSVYRIWRVGAGITSPVPPALLGSSIAVAPNQDGRLELFGVNSAGDVFHRWQLSPGGAWSAWSQMDGGLTRSRPPPTRTAGSSCSGSTAPGTCFTGGS